MQGDTPKIASGGGGGDESAIAPKFLTLLMPMNIRIFRS